MKDNPQRPKVGRRNILRGFGVSALATSAVVFGTSKAASAHYKHYACCHLVFTPSSYSTCRANSNYTWYCQATPTRGCGCCERKNSDGNIIASAYACDRV